eukprot:CAMPEP_0114532320 /NCGR_PEP_ID=MMETSP0109-20121206/26600_1 /TAXON_ID=29199 /ORGANISM="Chlorarachnion reptans, Strain CCCM449" /LENGTH=207 /DNA_ID=CAMNT_0001715371 /DNA_START=259 /DNA_END=878 /DNA_ORIENTATION=-
MISIFGIARALVDVISKFLYKKEIARAERDRNHELARLQSTFNFFDRDKDGVIDLEELRQMMIAMRKNMSKAEVVRLIKRVDPNYTSGRIVVDFPRFCMLLATFDAEEVGHFVNETEFEVSTVRRRCSSGSSENQPYHAIRQSSGPADLSRESRMRSTRLPGRTPSAPNLGDEEESHPGENNWEMRHTSSNASMSNGVSSPNHLVTR